MTYAQALHKYYTENKLYIRLYIIFSLLFSILCFGTGHFVFGAAVTTTTAVTSLGGAFGKLFAPVAESYLSDIDLPTTLTIVTTVAIIIQWIPDEFFYKIGIGGITTYSFGLLEYIPVQVFVYIYFIISKLSRSNHVSYSTGVVLESIENKLGVVLNLLIAASQLWANFATPDTTAMAAATDAANTVTTPGAESIVSGVFGSLLIFLIMVNLLVVHIFVRVLFYYIDIIMVPLSTMIPALGFSTETAKSVLVFVLAILAIFFPYLFLVLYAIIFVIAVIFFRRAFYSMRYFRAIYVRPLFKKISGYRVDIPLTFKRIPKKVRLFSQEEQPDIILPVYLLRKLSGMKRTFYYDRWWFVHSNNRTYICKPRFAKKDCRYMLLSNSENRKMFIRQSLFYHEVFNLSGTEENIGKPLRRIRKDIHFVFSKEYYHRFNEIKDITGFIDFKEYQKQASETYKMTKKAIREQKRLAKLEAREQKRIERAQKRPLLPTP